MSDFHLSLPLVPVWASGCSNGTISLDKNSALEFIKRVSRFTVHQFGISSIHDSWGNLWQLSGAQAAWSSLENQKEAQKTARCSSPVNSPNPLYRYDQSTFSHGHHNAFWGEFLFFIFRFGESQKMVTTRLPQTDNQTMQGRLVSSWDWI